MWLDEVKARLDDFVSREELPEGSIYIKNNYKRGSNSEISSYSVAIYEEDYPPTKNGNKDRDKNNYSVMNIAIAPTGELELIIDETQYGDVGEMDHTKSKKRKSESVVRVRVNPAQEGLADYIEKHVKYCYSKYESKASNFGCCSHFMECSDARKCVHPNKLYSKACYYRMNLDNGKIFYGKNKNID